MNDLLRGKWLILKLIDGSEVGAYCQKAWTLTNGEPSVLVMEVNNDEVWIPWRAVVSLELSQD